MSTLSFTPAPPQLKSLHTKPTWHNRAGRIDRSACFVITAAKLWRRVHEDDWTYRLGLGPTARGLCSSRLQALSPKPHHFGKCDRYATRNLYARNLWLLHKWQNPYPLQGDFRTPKSNAMRGGGLRPEACGLSQRRPQALSHKPQPPINPNRGVGFNMHKMLGLNCMWSTTLRIERYIQHEKLKQHFLVCPVCSGGADIPACRSAQPNDVAAGQRTGVSVAAGSQPGGQPAENHPSSRGPTAPLGGTSPPAKTPPQATCHKPKPLPPGRVTKLYLPLCTPKEYDDAQIAHLWLTTHTNPNRPLSPEAAALIQRYGELFAPRNLRCRHCLGLRYGEVKGGMGVSPVMKHHAGAMPHPSTKRKRVTRLTTDSNHSLTRRARTSQAPQPPGHARADQSARLHQDHPTARVVTRRLPEQQLFLTNLPKLLAPVPDASPPASPQRRRPAESNRVDTLSAEVKEKLYQLFAGGLPAFQKLQKVKQKSEHEA